MHHEDHSMFVGQAFGGIVMLAVCIDDTILWCWCGDWCWDHKEAPQ